MRLLGCSIIMKNMIQKLTNGHLSPLCQLRVMDWRAETIGDKIYVIAGATNPGLGASNINEIFQITKGS